VAMSLSSKSLRSGPRRKQQLPLHGILSKVPMREISVSMGMRACKPPSPATRLDSCDQGQDPATDGIDTQRQLTFMIESGASTYDAVRMSEAFAQTHPDPVDVATLFGMTLPVETCRVLELGCAWRQPAPMALAMPNARFLGIDLSAPDRDGSANVALLG